MFVDDKSRNLDAAQKLGWNVCHATGVELDKIKASIEAFLKNHDKNRKLKRFFFIPIIELNFYYITKLCGQIL